MTPQDHLEISRKLALAIGWKPEQMWVLGGDICSGCRCGKSDKSNAEFSGRPKAGPLE